MKPADVLDVAAVVSALVLGYTLGCWHVRLRLRRAQPDSDLFCAVWRDMWRRRNQW